MKAMKTALWPIGLAAALLLGGCGSAPEREAPQASAPGWKPAVNERGVSAGAALQRCQQKALEAQNRYRSGYLRACMYEQGFRE